MGSDGTEHFPIDKKKSSKAGDDRQTRKRYSPASSGSGDRRSKPNTNLYSSRVHTDQALLEKILDCFLDVMVEDVERRIANKDAQRRIVPTVGDAIRALQARREFTEEEAPTKMVVQWVETFGTD